MVAARFMIVNSDYEAFLRHLYTEHPGLATRSYAEQVLARSHSLFGVADFYSRNLTILGHEAEDVFLNNEAMQRAWAVERGLKLPLPITRLALGRRGMMPWPRRISDRDWMTSVFAAQVEEFQPDVLINLDMETLTPDLLREVRTHIGILIGQHAAVPLHDHDYKVYDLLLSSWPPTLAYFRRSGVPVRLFRLAFEHRIAIEMEELPRDLGITFVGSLSPAHPERTLYLEQICRAVAGVHIWGPSVSNLPRTSAIRRCYRGPAWGRQMYAVLARSRVTLNNHGLPDPHANNLRLYEATGMGTLLVTDWKPDLGDIFDVGSEILAYRSIDECIELLAAAAADPRPDIAAAGQARTLKDHTWTRRMTELLGFVGQ